MKAVLLTRTALALAAALALTACQPHAPDAAAAQTACERLVTQDPDDASFEHLTTTEEDDHWTVAGVVTIGDSADKYRCHVEFHDGADFTGHVYYVTQ